MYNEIVSKQTRIRFIAGQNKHMHTYVTNLEKTDAYNVLAYAKIRR